MLTCRVEGLLRKGSRGTWALNLSMLKKGGNTAAEKLFQSPDVLENDPFACGKCQ